MLDDNDLNFTGLRMSKFMQTPSKVGKNFELSATLTESNGLKDALPPSFTQRIKKKKG